MSKSYYNENDRFAAAWLRELIDEGLIPEGEVDERSITDIRGSDLVGFTQCHFFAGIGGWSYALQLAGWPEDRPVWTGSCPCQPLSSAGQRKGHDDERHLWPAFYELIAECGPSAVFGEQVASKDGREWLAGVRADLEDSRYAVGAADLCAAGAGAPHIRQRLFWVADAHQGRREQRDESVRTISQFDALGVVVGVADANGTRQQPSRWGGRCRATSKTRNNTWGRSKAVLCADGKARRVEPSVQPLADGIPNRVGTLRGAGNAIVPQVAAEFIGAYLDGHT